MKEKYIPDIPDPIEFLYIGINWNSSRGKSKRPKTILYTNEAKRTRSDSSIWEESACRRCFAPKMQILTVAEGFSPLS
jgi:hypothetical protein